MSKILGKTRPSIVKILYQLCYDTHTIFEYNNIKYWLDGGTLLGAIRCKPAGVISHDDDIDYAMESKYVKKFLSLRKNFNACGYDICKTFFGYKVFVTKRKKIDGECYSFPSLDIITMKEMNGKLVPSNKLTRDVWPKEVWNKTEVFPLKLYDFGEFQVYGPNKGKEYLFRYYGNDVMTHGYLTYNHEKEEFVESEKVKLTPELLKPAEPYDEVKMNRRCLKTCLTKSLDKVSSDSWKKKPTKTCSRIGIKCSRNFNVKMETYVISCGKIHSERLNKFMDHANKAGLNICKVNCVLGKKFKVDTLCKMVKDAILNPKAEMTKVEVSINMSHFNCWQKLINSCNDFGLVCEDDIMVHADFKEKINMLMDKLPKFSILHLHAYEWDIQDKKKRKVFKKIGGLTIMQENGWYNFGASCYIISKDYAKFLIKKSFPIRMPQDILMGSFPNRGMHLSLKARFDKEQDCYISPILDVDCGGPYSTGALSTQEHESPHIKTFLGCKKC